MAAPGVLDQQDQGGEGDDFIDEDAGSDDLADDVTVAASETSAPAESAYETPPSPPEEPAHIGHPEVDRAPASSDVASTSEPAVTSEPSDPFAREQS
jgi:hypothetical protein